MVRGENISVKRTSFDRSMSDSRKQFCFNIVEGGHKAVYENDWRKESAMNIMLNSWLMLGPQFNVGFIRGRLEPCN